MATLHPSKQNEYEKENRLFVEKYVLLAGA